jgi:microcystin-dependent protein
MGWMLCDGRELSTTEYGLLFGVIGYTFDTDLSGSSLFKLPDFRGTVPGIAGQPFFNQSVNSNSYNLGDSTGEQVHTLTVDEMPEHNHGTQTDLSGAPPELYNLTSTAGDHTHIATDSGHEHPYLFPTSQGVLAASGPNDVADDRTDIARTLNTTTGYAQVTLSNNGNHAHYLANTGGSNYHNNMQPTLFGGNMFIYSGKNMQAYFPYTWVGGAPAANGTAPTPGNVLVF